MSGLDSRSTILKLGSFELCHFSLMGGSKLCMNSKYLRIFEFEAACLNNNMSPLQSVKHVTDAPAIRFSNCFSATATPRISL